MYSPLTTLIDRLDSSALSTTNVIRWSCPVPSFGDLSRSRVATLGLNPSNREFVDELGKELEGASRRFHTLGSLRLKSWADVDSRHLQLIVNSCANYFTGNPYDRWFRKLDQIVQGAGASYYDKRSMACHLDLIPYATDRKWMELKSRQRSALMSAAGDTLALLLSASPVRTLILNGRSVVEHFQDVAGVRLDQLEMDGWSLRRESSANVRGMAYFGTVDALSGIPLGHDICVLGFNHNIQSSFGVTSEAICSIKSWISQASGRAAL
jgi:hypothetical protein